MTTLDERFIQLKGTFEEFKIVQEEKKDLMNKKNEMHALSKQFENTTKNIPIKHNTASDATLARIEYVRSSNDMVRKISEKRGLEFEDEINKLERDLFALIKEQKERDIQRVEYVKREGESEVQLKKLMAKELSKNEIDSLKKELNSQKEISKRNLKIAEDHLKRALEINDRGKRIEEQISTMTESFDSIIDFLDGEKPRID